TRGMPRRRRWSLSFAQRLSLYILTAAFAVLLTAGALNYLTARRALEAQTDREELKHVQAAAKDIDDFVLRVAALPRSIAARQEVLGAEADPLVIPFLARLLTEAPPEVYGLYIALEHRKWTDELAMPWVDRASWPRLRQVQYDYHDPRQEWYAGPKRTGKLHVTEPYYDEGGSNITMVSVTVPVYEAQAGLIGVAGADLALDRLGPMLAQLRLRVEGDRTHDGEYAYLVSRGGRIINHPNEMLMLRRGFPGEDVRALPDGRLAADRPQGTARLAMD